MSTLISTDVCIIGGGAAGLSFAAGASQMGAKVVLVEKHKMGGDCLNYGCVPSKALLAAAKKIHEYKSFKHFGIHTDPLKVDFKQVMAHVHDVIKTLSKHDSVERFEALGVNVIHGEGKFKDPKTLVVNEYTIKARKFIIATGSSPFIPPIPGLNSINYLTNETVFNLTELPKHLVVIGGGPIGCELAQAFHALGSKVTIIEGRKLLQNDDPELVNVIKEHFLSDGLKFIEKATVSSIKHTPQSIELTYQHNNVTHTLSGSHLLISAGRKPNINGLNLELANVEYSRKGIEVDSRLRTTNKHIYALGDVAGKYQFTHIAGYHASIAIKNILFKLPAKVDYSTVPWVTYTYPEIANVGLSESAARKKHTNIRVLTQTFKDNDRAQTDGNTQGKIKVITSKKGHILGASIVGPHAGELLGPWIIALQTKQKISTIASAIFPYPTLSEISKKAAGSFFTDFLYSNTIKKVVRFLKKFG